MTIGEMLGQSGILTVLGMGIVFSFLIIMIIMISALGKVISSRGKGTNVVVPSAPAGAPATAGDGAVVAAISAAVSEYRKNE